MMWLYLQVFQQVRHRLHGAVTMAARQKSRVASQIAHQQVILPLKVNWPFNGSSISFEDSKKMFIFTRKGLEKKTNEWLIIMEYWL